MSSVIESFEKIHRLVVMTYEHLKGMIAEWFADGKPLY